MKMTKEQLDQLYEVAKPVIRWTRENLHPNCSLKLNERGIIINEELAGLSYFDFEKESLD